MQSLNQTVFAVPELSPDPRVLVFRRILHGVAEFEGMQVDAYAVVGSRYVVLLDTLLCPADMQGVWTALTPALSTRQALCINSHADWDHTWGNGYLGETHQAIPLIGHEHCRQRLLSTTAQQELQDFQTHYALFHDVTLVPPRLTLRESLTIHDPELTIELLHAPGHCPDHLVAWLPALRLLLAFDAIEYPLPGIEDAASVPQMFATLERLAALDARYVLCSHGGTSHPGLIKENLAYLRTIEQRATAYLAHASPATSAPEHAADAIGYPFDDALTSTHTGEVDRAYYSWSHEHNVKAVLDWLSTR